METYIFTYKTYELSPDYCSYSRYEGANDYEFATTTISANSYDEAKRKAYAFLDEEARYFGRAYFVSLNWLKPKKRA